MESMVVQPEMNKTQLIHNDYKHIPHVFYGPSISFHIAKMKQQVRHPFYYHPDEMAYFPITSLNDFCTHTTDIITFNYTQRQQYIHW
jgi:hypothetical protein